MKIKDTQIYDIFNLLSLVLYVRISIATCGKYRAVRHIDCASGANIDLLIVPSSTVAATTVPLPHGDCFAIGGRLAKPSGERLGQKKVLTHAVGLA